jgi:hypothetical protein
MHTGAIETAEFDLAEHETATVHSGDTENTEYYEKLRTQFKVSSITDAIATVHMHASVMKAQLYDAHHALCVA